MNGIGPEIPKFDEHRLAMALANFPGMAYRCRNGRDGTMEFVTGGCEALTGYKAAGFMGAGARSVDSLIHPGDRERVRNGIQEALQRRRPFRLTYRILTADGREKRVWEQGAGVYSEAGLEALEGFISDVTGALEAEAELQAQNERFRRIVDNAGAGYFRIGRDGRYEDVNPAWLRMYGFASREEAVGLHFSAVQNPAHVAQAAGIVQTLLRGEPVSSEFSRLRRDGTAGYHYFSANPIFESGQVTGFEGFLIDISGWRNASEERRQAEQRYRSLFDSMHEGVALHELVYAGGVPVNYILIDVNRRYEEMLGVRREDVVNKPATEVYGTGEAPYLKEWAPVAETGTPVQIETYFAPMDKYFLISVAPMGSRCFATIFFDITEQKKTEERYKLISTNAADVIWLWDLEVHRCTFISPPVVQLRGFTPEEVIAQPLEEMMPPDSSRMALAELRRRIVALEAGDETARTGTYELEFLRRDGTAVMTETVTKLVSDERGRVRLIVGISRDITERKQAEAARTKLEDQLRQAQKLESVGRLAGGVAHDFNNLLTVINGYSEFLLERLQPPDPLFPYAEAIRNAGERAAGLTRQLLAFSRKQTIQPRVLDLNEAIRGSVPILQRLIGEDVALETHLDGSLGPVMADPDQIHQVVMNLAVNARDAMPNGGTLDIRTENAELDEAGGAAIDPGVQPGRYVRIAVRDTGHGMDEATRRQIFEPFFTTKEEGKGTGLGLATVYGIVRQSGGWIHAASEVGVGTSFAIYLPRLDARSKTEDRAAGAPAKEGSETVLVVEDQPAVRAFAKAVLERYGYRTVEASGGEEALDTAARYPGRIHVLLTDVVLPGMNGNQLAARLKEARPDMKVLFMSGYTSDIIAHHGVVEDGVAYLPKPFSPDKLAAKIREVLAVRGGAGR